MTVTNTAIQVVSDVPDSSVSGLLTALEAVFDNRSTELPEQAVAANEVPTDATTGTPNHIRQVKRLSLSEDTSAAVGGLVTALENNSTISWYEVRVHDCHHDLSTGAGTGPCPDWSVGTDSNGNTARSGTVPEGV